MEGGGGPVWAGMIRGAPRQAGTDPSFTPWMAEVAAAAVGRSS